MSEAIMQDFERLTAQDIENLTQQGIELPLNISALRDYLPHGYPFLLLDRVTACCPDQWITAIKNVTINEPYFLGHFPKEPIMPGVLLVEAMAQVSGVLCFISQQKKPADGYNYLLVGVDKVRFRQPVIPADQVILRSKKIDENLHLFKFQCTAHVNDHLVASAEILLSEQQLWLN